MASVPLEWSGQYCYGIDTWSYSVLRVECSAAPVIVYSVPRRLLRPAGTMVGWPFPAARQPAYMYLLLLS